jgi:hypothetical protein
MSDHQDDALKPVNETDREAARRALARNRPDLDPTSDKYAKLLEALADLHRHFGSESFELRFNLRLPRDRVEEWNRQYMHEEITEEELRDRLKADAERPIDLEMLTVFTDAYQERLTHYSRVLQEAIPRPHEAGTLAWRKRERAIDEHVAVLTGKLPLWSENFETVINFLEEMRVAAGNGLVKVGDFETISAHWLAHLVMTRAAEAWRKCKETAKRSRRDPRYLYATTATHLFSSTWVPTLPPPQILSEKVRHEFLMARIALREVKTKAAPIAAEPENSQSGVDLDWAIDNESRELDLVGQMISIVAKAGHIYRPTSMSDWGIDGEIEFKDSAGNASGRRLYVQLKSGDSHLARRKCDGEEIFTVKNARHLEYWAQHAYPVMLVIQQSNGVIRWMDVSAYLKQNGRNNRQIIFRGEPLTPENLRRIGETTPGDSTRPDEDCDNAVE